MLSDRPAFVHREPGHQRLVGKQREHRFLMRKLGAEAVHDANLAVAVCLHQRMVQREAQQKLLRADAPVDQIDFERAGAQHAVLYSSCSGETSSVW